MEAVLEPMPVDRRTPAQLVAAAVAGDRDAFGALVEPHLAVALGASRVITRSHADAADAVQEALLATWLELDRLRDPVAFPAWFRTHVIRAALRVARRGVRVAQLHLVMPGGTGTDDQHAIERAVERRDLARAFDRLSADDRALLTMRHLWDAPVAEVADALGIPTGTVKSRTHAALERLRAAYDAETRR